VVKGGEEDGSRGDGRMETTEAGVAVGAGSQAVAVTPWEKGQGL
jgi:hypothetical protein